MSNVDGNRPEFEDSGNQGPHEGAPEGAGGHAPGDELDFGPEGAFDAPEGAQADDEPAGGTPDFGLPEEDAIGPVFADDEESDAAMPDFGVPGSEEGGAEPDFAMPAEQPAFGASMAEGADDEPFVAGAADDMGEAEPAVAAKGKKGKKKKSKAAKPKKAGKPLLERIAEASPYTVMLGISLVALIAAVVFLAIELNRYDFDLEAEQAKQTVRAAPASGVLSTSQQTATVHIA